MIFTLSLACEEGWYLLPTNVEPEDRSCFANFDRQEISGGHDLCAGLGAGLPYPVNQFEVDSLKATLVELGIEGNSGKVIGISIVCNLDDLNYCIME